MGLTIKDMQEMKDNLSTAKRTSMHSRKDYRHSLHRHISNMFNDSDANDNR